MYIVFPSEKTIYFVILREYTSCVYFLRRTRNWTVIDYLSKYIDPAGNSVFL